MHEGAVVYRWYLTAKLSSWSCICSFIWHWRFLLEGAAHVQFYLTYDSEVFCLKVQFCTILFDIWHRRFLLEGATGYSCSHVEGRTWSGTSEGDGGLIQDSVILLLVPWPIRVGLAPVLCLRPWGFQYLVNYGRLLVTGGRLRKDCSLRAQGSSFSRSVYVMSA